MLHFSLLHLYGTNTQTGIRQVKNRRPEAQYHSLIQFFSEGSMFSAVARTFSHFAPSSHSMRPKSDNSLKDRAPKKSW